MDLRVLGIIPARGNSKGVKKKNIRNLQGKPLLSYVASAALDSKRLTKVILSTDDENIAKVGQECGLEVPFLRPVEFAKDDSTLMEVCQHGVAMLEKKGEKFDAVMSIQPTAPFLQSSTIDNAITKISDPTAPCDSVTSIAEATRHPQILLNRTNDVITYYFPDEHRERVRGRQQRNPVYYLTGAFYLWRMEELLRSHEGGHALGKLARSCLLGPIEAVDINSELDFLFAETIAEKSLCINEQTK